MDPRQVICSGLACTKTAKIPANRRRPNKWFSERHYGPDYKAIADRYFCPDCFTLREMQRDRERLEAKFAAERKAKLQEEAEEAERAEENRLAAEAYAKLPEGFVSWSPEVIADSSDKWCGNALRFATRREADENVLDLSYRWTLVRETRTVPSKDPVNYIYGPEGLKPV
jgi:hypothetical protein